MTYLEDGRCSLLNNMSDNSIRPVVVGRKNWLFSDTKELEKLAPWSDRVQETCR